MNYSSKQHQAAELLEALVEDEARVRQEGYDTCVYCGGNGASPGRPMRVRSGIEVREPHFADCPWDRARAWLCANGFMSKTGSKEPG